MDTPINTLLKHIDEVITAFEKAGSTKEAYKLLNKVENIKNMPFNTFKTIAPAIVQTVIFLKKATDVIPPVESIVIPEVVMATPAVDPTIMPKKFGNWIVCKGNDGYIRMNKVINEKNKSIYIGKYWDPIKAKEKITSLEINSPELPQLTQLGLIDDNNESSVVNTDLPVPKHFMGWSVTIGVDGFIRMNRMKNSKRYNIYIGKYWDPIKAQNRASLVN